MVWIMSPKVHLFLPTVVLLFSSLESATTSPKLLMLVNLIPTSVCLQNFCLWPQNSAKFYNANIFAYYASMA